MPDDVKDAFSKIISQANEEGVFISAEKLGALASIAKEGHKRLDIIERITSNASAIVANAARALFVEQPQLIAPGGNAYTNRHMAACLRDMEIILRYVTYAMFAGDPSVLDDRCLNGLRETYQSLGVPGNSVAVAVEKMKSITIAIANDPLGVTPGDCSTLMSELAGYFDRASATVVEYATVAATEVLQQDANSVPNELSTEKIGDEQPQSEVVNDTLTLKTLSEKNHPVRTGSGIEAIDSKQVSAWISQEDGTELQEPLVVGTTYTLNLRLAQDPGPSLTEVNELFSTECSIDTQWIVTSSSVELTEETTAIESISTTKLDSQTVWSVELFVPIFLRRKPTISLKITPTKTDALVTVLIFIYEKLYWQFSLPLTVKSLELKDLAYSTI